MPPLLAEPTTRLDDGPLNSTDALEILSYDDAELKLHDLRQDLAEIEALAATKREEFKHRMAACDERERSVAAKQARLEKIVGSIEQHLRQNDRKWIHSIARYEEEHAQVVSKDAEITELRRLLEQTRLKKVEVQYRLSRDSKYVQYLAAVVKDEALTFDTVESITQRFNALLITSEETKTRMSEAALQLNVLRAELQSFSAEHLDIVLGQTSEMSVRSKDVEILREGAFLRREKQDAGALIEKETRRRRVESLLAIQNLYYRVRTRAVALDPETQLFEVLGYIGRRIRLFQETILHFANAVPDPGADAQVYAQVLSRTGLDKATVKRLKATAREIVATRPVSAEAQRRKRAPSPSGPRSSDRHTENGGTDPFRAKLASWVQQGVKMSASGSSSPSDRPTSRTLRASPAPSQIRRDSRPFTPTSPTPSQSGGAAEDRSPTPGSTQPAKLRTAATTPSRFANTPLSAEPVLASPAATPAPSNTQTPGGGFLISRLAESSTHRGPLPPTTPSDGADPAPSPRASTVTPRVLAGPGGPGPLRTLPLAQSALGLRPASNTGSVREEPGGSRASTPTLTAVTVRPPRPALKQVTDRDLFSFSLEEGSARASSATGAASAEPASARRRVSIAVSDLQSQPPSAAAAAPGPGSKGRRISAPHFALPRPERPARSSGSDTASVRGRSGSGSGSGNGESATFVTFVGEAPSEADEDLERVRLSEPIYYSVREEEEGPWPAPREESLPGGLIAASERTAAGDSDDPGQAQSVAPGSDPEGGEQIRDPEKVEKESEPAARGL